MDLAWFRRVTGARPRHLAVAGLLTAFVALPGLNPGHAAASTPAAPALNGAYLEADYGGALFVVNYPTVAVTAEDGSLTLDVSNGNSNQEWRMTLIPPGSQSLTAGNVYDTDDGLSMLFTPPGGASGLCADADQNDSSVEVDQASYDSSGNPTTLGIQFDAECSGGNDEFFGALSINLRPSTPGQGYYLYGDNGALTGFGDDSYLNYLGDLSVDNLNQPIVGMATTPDGGGYWMVASDGGIFAFGDAAFYGSTGNLRLNQPIVGMAATPDGGGYWLVASDGGIFAFGDAAFRGSTGNLHLNQPIVGMATDHATGGYWLVAADGGIFAFDAPFLGSTGNLHLAEPIVGLAAMPDDLGYLFVASDGGVFTYGDAAFHGTAATQHRTAPIVGLATTPDGGGYWEVAGDGTVFNFGDAAFAGDLSGLGITNVVGVTH
jgi:hypothetical protein